MTVRLPDQIRADPAKFEPTNRELRARWLGRVGYPEAFDLQSALYDRRVAQLAPDYLLMLEHPDVYTLGRSASPEHLLVSREDFALDGVSVIEVNRGGDVTYHGPGQLVAYPIIRLNRLDVVAYVRALESAVISAVGRFGISASWSDGYTGVWVGDEKLCAIGVRVSRMTTMHGIALNVSTNLQRFQAIVPCGIPDRGVTSLEKLTGRRIPMGDVVTALAESMATAFGATSLDIVAPEASHDDPRLSRPGVSTSPVAAIDRDRRPRAVDGTLRPESLRVRAEFGHEYRSVRRLVSGLSLHTVCESAACPNIYECWSQKTATLMILGNECTRACGFCKIETARPSGVDEGEPDRVADAVVSLGLEYAVLTSVARDDLPDGGSQMFARCIGAIHEVAPECEVEVLIPDFKGDPTALATVIEAGPVVLNHNVETVPRLQRAVRHTANYARSLAVLARARRLNPDVTTKSGLMVGLGEERTEVEQVLADLAAIGVGIVTIGQYLAPSASHLQVSRWWSESEFDEVAAFGESLGIGRVEAGPLVRSSYHARASADRMRRHPHSAGFDPIAGCSN